MSALPAAALARQQVWSRHWARLPAGANVGSFASGYGGTAIESWWKATFQECAHLLNWLDLASGNGAIPHLWLQAPLRSDALIVACDLAVAAPGWLDQLDGSSRTRVDWRAATNAEEVPLASNSCDVITSQYGIEYTNLERSLPEALRILRTTGELRFVMHHAESRPVSLARIELRYLDSLLDVEHGLFACGLDLIEPYAQTATAEGRAAVSRDPSANARRLRFNNAESTLRRSVDFETLPELHDETVRAMGELFRLAATSGIAAAGAFADDWRLLLTDRHTQLVELIACALTPDGMASFRDRLLRADMRVEHGELQEDSRLLAWWVKAGR